MQKVARIVDLVGDLMRETEEVPHGAKYVNEVSDIYGYGVKVLTTGAVEVTSSFTLEEAGIKDMCEHLALVNQEMVERLAESSLEDGYAEAIVGVDSIYLMKSESTISGECTLRLSGMTQSELSKRISFWEKNIASVSQKEEVSGVMPAFTDDLVGVLGAIVNERKRKQEEIEERELVRRRIGRFIQEYQDLYPREKGQLDESAIGLVMQDVESLADENVREAMTGEELQKLRIALDEAEVAGLETFVVSGTTIEIRPAEVLQRSFWEETMPRVQEQFEEMGYKLIHNMKSMNSARYSIENGIASKVRYAAELLENDKEILTPYLRELNGKPAEIMYSMLSVDTPRYSDGSIQGGNFAQVRLPLDTELSRRTLFFTKDTGQTDAAIGLSDSGAAEERRSAVMDSHAAKLLFCMRHVRMDLEEAISGDRVTIGDFNLVEGNTIVKTNLKYGADFEMILSNKQENVNDMTKIRKLLEEREIQYLMREE